MSKFKFFGWLLAAALLIFAIAFSINKVQSASNVPAYVPPTIESETKENFGSNVTIVDTMPVENNETKALMKDNDNNFFFDAIFSESNYLVMSNYIEHYVGKQLDNMINARLQANGIYGRSFVQPNKIAGDTDQQQLSEFIKTTQPEYFFGNIYLFDNDFNLETVTNTVNDTHMAIDNTAIQLEVFVLHQDKQSYYDEQFMTLGNTDVLPEDISEKYIINSVNGSTSYEKVQ